MSARVVWAAGPVVRARGLADVTPGEAVRVGPRRLLGEVRSVSGPVATLEVYEDTAGLQIGDPVEGGGRPLLVQLGPGLLGSVYDGLQRPLDALDAAGTWRLGPGLEADPLDRSRRWPFTPARAVGDDVAPGDVLGRVAEGPIEHRILVPPDAPPGRLLSIGEGEYTVADEIGRLAGAAAGSPQQVLRLAQAWPMRHPRPHRERLPIEVPLVTGQRVIDTLLPLGKGGTAVIPGGFGTGKTVVEQTLARWSDADVVVYVGCGERGNEMAELLASFPELDDPRTGRPLLERTVLIANTSNMPVAAREASVQLGVTIAEYFRDQGLEVALLADSTSRWAEALREISGRLEELPGEEGYPAYLGSRLAALYERAGNVVALGSPERRGSLSIIAAVSPPGGDFSEPVTQASLRLAGTFWALDTDLAHARHFPAISWTRSYSLYVAPLTAALSRIAGEDWGPLRARAIALLNRERELLEIVQLVGPDALPDDDRILLEEARILREAFLRQHAFDPIDAFRPPDVQLALLRAVLATGEGLRRALDSGLRLSDALASPLVEELRRTSSWTGPDLVARLHDLADRVRRWAP